MFEDYKTMKNPLKLSIGEIIFYTIVLMVFIIFFGLFSEMILHFILPKNKITFTIITPLFWALPFIALMISVNFLHLKPKNETFNFNFSRFNFKLIFLILFAFSGLFLITEFLTNLVPQKFPFLPDDLYNTFIKEVLKMLHDYPLASIIMIAIGAPIFEEIVFRGIFLKGMLNNNVSPKYAILVSAFLFGFVHLNPWQFVGAFIFGCFFGYVYYKTQSLLTTMLLHCINNSLGIIFFFEYGNTDFNEISGYTPESLFIVGLLIFLIFFLVLHQLTKNKKWLPF